jgi:hypothetical protein
MRGSRRGDAAGPVIRIGAIFTASAADLTMFMADP